MALSHGRKQWSSAVAAAVLLTNAPAAAQTAPAGNRAAPVSIPAPPPAGNDVVGPATLRDFTLNGTVTRRAEPVAATPAPARTTAPAAAARAPAPPPRRNAAPARDPAAPSGRDVSPATSAPLSLPQAALPSPAVPGFAEEARAPTPTSTPRAPPSAAPEPGLPWPWFLAALALALGAALFVRQRRQGASRNRQALAGAAATASPPPPRPQAPPPAAVPPVPKSPAAPPRAPAPVPGGIVASGLKPKLGFELHPIRAETDATRGAALLFDVIVINSGSAPARDVLVEARLINAGPAQDEQIGRFFREPVGDGERLPVIPPMGRVSIKTRLSIPGDQLVPVTIEGRPLFVPLVAFNALYRWSGGDEQDSASFLVGRGDDAGKMAPFRLDQGARSWSGLGARPHSMGLQR